MKSLTYSLALLSFFLMIASCKKDGALPAVKSTKVDSTKISTVPPGCDSAKLINYVLYNSTGVDTYEIAFAGQTNYTFMFPAHGSTTVAVKPGVYSVFIYSPGNYAIYNFNLSGELSLKGSGARYTVTVSACEGPQFASIVPVFAN